MHVCVRVFVWVDVNVCMYACVGVCLQKFLWLCRISNIVMHVCRLLTVLQSLNVSHCLERLSEGMWLYTPLNSACSLACPSLHACCV